MANKYCMENPYIAIARSLWSSYFPHIDKETANADISNDSRFNIACSMLHCFQDPEQWRPLIEDFLLQESDLYCIRLCHQNLICHCSFPEILLGLQRCFDEYIACMGLALSMLRYEKSHLKPQKITVRLRNVSPVSNLAQIKSHLLNQLVRITGTVVRVGAVQPLVMRCEFICAHCEASSTWYFPQGRYTPPETCGACRSRTMCMNRSTAETIDYQRIKLQEMEDCESATPGRMPRMLEIELCDDLVDSCIPGNTVSVTGVVRSANDVDSTQKSALQVLHVSANNIENLSNIDNPSEIEPLPADLLFKLQSRASQNLLFDYTVHSFCCGIYGNELVKAGLVLALFGSSNNARCVRKNSHVLLVGDPGLGKSQMLRAASALSNRSVYVSGRSVTSTGLTVTMTKDSAGDYALEAGALVMADQGICCIDELDKSKGEIEAVLEAMEQQCISIAKAGMVCTMNARTSVLAAANPRHGHFKKERTIGQNLEMKAALLSRFDLMFVLIDSPDERRDKLLTSHVLKMHAAENGIVVGPGPKAVTPSLDWSEMHVQERLVKTASLDGEKRLSSQELKQLITYARQNVHPRLSESAARLLQEEYLRLRSSNAMLDEGVPVTTRQLESLVRLAHARARADLSDIVTLLHAKDVVEIMGSCLRRASQVSIPSRSQNSVSQWSTPKKLQLYVEHLSNRAHIEKKIMYTYSELKELEEDLGLKVVNFHDFIDVLRDRCILLKKGPQVFEYRRASLR